MGLKGKMIGQTEVKHSVVGDALHDLMTKRAHDLASVSPQVKGFTLLEGEAGAVGSKILWHYNHDGKDRVAKDIIEDIDEENQSIRVRVLEGDLMELYKSFIFTYHVDTKGEDKLITWTFEYEKLNEDIPHPGTLLNYFLKMVEDIEAHHLKNA